MEVLSISKMQELEKETYQNYGLNESLIIENVGMEGARFIHFNLLKKKNFKEVVVIVGKGNNGADGLAMARHLKNLNHFVSAKLLYPPEMFSKELQKSYHQAKQYGVSISIIDGHEDIDAILNDSRTLIIDAILGTGIRFPLKDDLREYIKKINAANNFILSVDIPSGILGNNGKSDNGLAIVADVTLTIGLPKIGHFLNEGVKCRGQLKVISGGFPKELLSKEGEYRSLDIKEIPVLLPKRDKWEHKNSFGHLGIIGGSEGLCGAPLMASQAAIRTGAGLVSVYTFPENYNHLINRVSPEVMAYPWPPQEEWGKSFISKLNEKHNTLLVGPGLSTRKEAYELVSLLIKEYQGNLILDADAINVLSFKEDACNLKNREEKLVMTPHLGEFIRFMGISKGSLHDNTLRHLEDFVEKTRSFIILKSAVSILSGPNKGISFFAYPNDGLATAGSGDVLAGILGGFLAQKSNDPFKMISLATALHSKIGTYAANKWSSRSMSAGLLSSFMGDVLKEFEVQ